MAVWLYILTRSLTTFLKHSEITVKRLNTEEKKQQEGGELVKRQWQPYFGIRRGEERGVTD